MSPSLAVPILISFLYYVSIALTAPALPAFCNALFAAPGTDTVNPQGASLHGLFSSVDQLFTFLFVGFWGALSDEVGRRPLMVLSSAGLAAGWLTVALGSSASLLVAGRAVDGATSCMSPVAQSMVRDLSAPADLGKNLGRLQGLSVGAAFLIGGVAGGVLTQHRGPRFVFACAAAVAAANTLLALAILRESLPSPRAANTWRSQASRFLTVCSSKANPLQSLRLLCASRESAGTALAFLLFWTGLNGVQVNLFNYAQHRFSLSKVSRRPGWLSCKGRDSRPRVRSRAGLHAAACVRVALRPARV